MEKDVKRLGMSDAPLPVVLFRRVASCSRGRMASERLANMG